MKTYPVQMIEPYHRKATTLSPYCRVGTMIATPHDPRVQWVIDLGDDLKLVILKDKHEITNSGESTWIA